MIILILGGTGAMGKYLVSSLDSEENEVYVTSRGSNISTSYVNYLCGDAKDDDFMNSLLNRHWDVIVDFMVYSTQEFEGRVLKLLKSTSQYIYLSSARVYANSEEKITEDSTRLIDANLDEEYLTTDEYALSKARQENILFNSELKNWTIVRPYITFGENRFQLGVLEKEQWLYRARKGRTIVFSKDINDKYTTITSGRDVSLGIKSLIGEKEALGEAFHITNGKEILWKNILDIYENILNKHNVTKTKIILQELPEFIDWYPGRYQVKYDRLYDRSFDNSKINKFVNVSIFRDPIDELSDCFDRFIQSPNYNNIDWKSEAIKDRLVGEYTSMKEIKEIKQKAKYIFYRYLAF